MKEQKEVDWLNEEELAAFVSLMRVNLKLINKLDRQLRSDAKMNFYDYSVLSHLSEAPERTLCMSELSAATGGSLSRLSQVVTRLEKRGWVERRTGARDGRFTAAVLTELGWEQVKQAAPGHVDAARRIVIDRLTKAQVRQLTQINNRIILGIEAER
ncbi:MarR family transcriptional regulator [Corynebacterium phocae]|uniref:MarR family transcriptional regulator n=1 Tax=Corynebacterium phocae TaxID=161895 RepID=A0A1L7D0H1_9CORY|nr:MarR family transcriptional regulator [Corynebacterium phocae]APT91594.1 MarR family transcriptional regulator [Corynebacterium phocae]KAA8720662.1 MarR family transcriptional regulator [Corynebacterium phocae]